jgi:hypothetical protein
MATVEMAIHFSVDEKARIVHLRCFDPLGVDEVTAALERQIRDGYWKYGTLVDARLSGLDFQQSLELFACVRQLVAEHGPNGPVAFVSRTAKYVVGAQTIAFRGGEISKGFEVFWDVDDANPWLLKMLGGTP